MGSHCGLKISQSLASSCGVILVPCHSPPNFDSSPLKLSSLGGRHCLIVLFQTEEESDCILPAPPFFSFFPLFSLLFGQGCLCSTAHCHSCRPLVKSHCHLKLPPSPFHGKPTQLSGVLPGGCSQDQILFILTNSPWGWPYKLNLLIASLTCCSLWLLHFKKQVKELCCVCLKGPECIFQAPFLPPGPRHRP